MTCKLVKNPLGDKLPSLLERGFFHIFGANAINKVMAFGTNIVIVWFLTKENYGIFSYANNLYSIVLLITGLGLNQGAFQFRLENRPQEEKDAIFWYVLSRGVAIDVLLALLMLAIGLLVPLSINTAGRYIALFGPLVILSYVFEFLTTALRVEFENERYAVVLSVNTVTYLGSACIGAYLGGIAGTILARYISYVLSNAMAYSMLFRRNLLPSRGGKLGKSLRSELWRYSIGTQLSWALNQLTYLLDVFLVGQLIADAEVLASYKVATTLPEGLLFIPSSVLTFVLPYFVAHNGDREWMSKQLRAFFTLAFVVYGLISLFLVVFAPFIIRFLWGQNYIDAVPSFRILAASFVFSALRAACTNILSAVRAVRQNLTISFVALVINACLCLSMIPRFGIIGASLAPLLVSIITCGIAGFYLVQAVRSIGEV